MNAVRKFWMPLTLILFWFTAVKKMRCVISCVVWYSSQLWLRPVYSDTTQPNSTLRRVELRRRSVYSDPPTQINSTSSWVELRRYKRAFMCIDSAVKLTLYDGKKKKKKVSTTRKSSINPYFNESFTFDVTLQQIQVVLVYFFVAKSLWKLFKKWTLLYFCCISTVSITTHRPRTSVLSTWMFTLHQAVTNLQ